MRELDIIVALIVLVLVLGVALFIAVKGRREAHKEVDTDTPNDQLRRKHERVVERVYYYPDTEDDSDLRKLRRSVRRGGRVADGDDNDDAADDDDDDRLVKYHRPRATDMSCSHATRVRAPLAQERRVRFRDPPYRIITGREARHVDPDRHHVRTFAATDKEDTEWEDALRDAEEAERAAIAAEYENDVLDALRRQQRALA